jgi:hypothetical protein
MATDSADLFIERDDVLGRETQLEATLLGMPGVQAARVSTPVGESIEARVRVDFDAATTNPVILREALATHGITVLSAAEHAERVSSGDPTGPD